MTALVLDIPAEEYHADPGERPSLSSSIARLLCSSSPAHAWACHPRLNPAFEEEHRTEFDLGKAAHGILLEGQDRTVEVDAKDWRTAKAKAEREAAWEAGQLPLLPDQARRVREMVKAVVRQLAPYEASPPLLGFVDGGRTPGKAEQTLIWDEGGVLCRALLDWLHEPLPVVDDLKTTSGSAAPEVWSRGQPFTLGYDISAAFYLRGLRALGHDPREMQFRWIVAETRPPYAVAVYEPGPDVMAVANAKVDYALEVWQRCLESGEWPAYPPRVATLELPPWEEPRWLEREARG